MNRRAIATVVLGGLAFAISHQGSTVAGPPNDPVSKPTKRPARMRDASGRLPQEAPSLSDASPAEAEAARSGFVCPPCGRFIPTHIDGVLLRSQRARRRASARRAAARRHFAVVVPEWERTHRFSTTAAAVGLCRRTAEKASRRSAEPPERRERRHDAQGAKSRAAKGRAESD
jgi:hypothetical protein